MISTVCEAHQATEGSELQRVVTLAFNCGATKLENIFADTAYGKAALKKLEPVAEGFMLFECGWLGKKLEEMTVMQAKGAVFREAKSGKNKGKRCILVKGTERTAFVTKEEIAAFSWANVTLFNCV